MQNIGLMMTRNEGDCVEEVMREYSKYFDKILVLDGSTDNTPEIIQSFKNVVYFAKDQDVLPGIKIRDGARQVLLEKAQSLFGYDGWFTLLHGDEIFHDDPNKVLTLPENKKVDRMHWYSMQFFLHQSQKNSYQYQPGSMQKNILWYCPGFIEIRQFRNKKGIAYQLQEHTRLFPHGLNHRINNRFPVFKHYPYRSAEQINHKTVQTNTSHFGGAYSQTIQENVFLEKLPTYKQVRQYDGSFHEFEMKNQKPLWLRAFSQWKYR